MRRNRDYWSDRETTRIRRTRVMKPVPIPSIVWIIAGFVLAAAVNWPIVWAFTQN